MKIERLPRNDKTNAWNTILPSRDGHPTLEADINADWLVIGAGYAGLGAARRLAENCPDEKIVLLDAGLVGENASGRNSGFGIDLPHATSTDPGELAKGHAYLRLVRAALDYLEGQVKTHSIDCDWSRDGKYQTTVTDDGKAQMLDPFVEMLEMLGEPYEWVNGDDLVERVGFDHFKWSVYTPGCILMNPAALVRGLVDSLPKNVFVHEETPVTEIEYRNGITATTSGGSVRAPKLILATNGFSEQFGFMKGKFLHFAAHASLTRPLTEEERDVYPVKPWGITPANAFAGITQRYTNDHRLLIRQDIHINESQYCSPAMQAKKAVHHSKLFHERFPMLPEVTIEDTWTGYVCLSRNGAPAWGQVAPNVWVAACQNAIGVTKGTIGGVLVADLATGRDNPLIEDMESLGSPTDLPHPVLTAIGSRLRQGWESWKGRGER